MGSGIAPRAPQAPLAPSVPPPPPIPHGFGPASSPVPGSIPIPSAPGTSPTVDSDYEPTPQRPQAQTIHTVRQLIETVAVPRLSLTVEREGGIATQRGLVHDGDLCKIGSHASNDIVLRDPMVSRFHCRLVREDGQGLLKETPARTRP